MKMPSTYNPYSAINAIYNYKKEWDDADKAGDTNKKNKAAENASVFYQQLRDNKYGNVADQLSAVDVSGAKYILDQYSAKDSGVDNQAYSTSMQSAVNKNNKLADYIDSDRNDVQGKYNSIYDYANQDVTKTDEYQSTYKKMMGKYDLAGLQGRDNAVASGGASNGGNIDSYAAANAMRQQASLTAQGQQIAHQAGLDAHNARVSNVAKILSDLGVYNSGTYDAMNQTIANDAGIAQQYFDNSETAKNNEVARLSEQASVTGYTPNEWVIKNDDIYNQFLNEDGTFKTEKEGVDIQALINQAKASGDTETAKKLAVVRTRKILGNYGEFGKYSNIGDISSMTPQQTEAGRVADMNNATVLKSLETESADKRYEIDEKAKLEKQQMEITLKELQAKANEGNYAAGELNGFLATWNASDTGPRSFITNVLWKDYINNGVTPSPEELKNLIVEKTKDHNIDVEDAKRICEFFSVSTDWLKDFEDCTSADDYYDKNNNLVKGDYLGMKKKNK